MRDSCANTTTQASIRRWQAETWRHLQVLKFSEW